jgi:hypothetical protein
MMIPKNLKDSLWARVLSSDCWQVIPSSDCWREVWVLVALYSGEWYLKFLVMASCCSGGCRSKVNLRRPNLEYAATAWDPYTKFNINKLEKCQRRAARFVIGYYSRESSVTSMLKELKWPTLQQRSLYFFSRRHRWHLSSWWCCQCVCSNLSCY